MAKRAPLHIRRSLGLATIDVVIMALVVGGAGAAAFKSWAVATSQSAMASEHAAGYAAARSALDEARSRGFPACGAGPSPTPCALPSGGAATELLAAGWRVSASARLATAIPAEPGAYAPSGDLVLVTAVATSPSGAQWTLSALQAKPAP